MFKRKLAALDHVNPESINVSDDASFKELIVWLEDQKIRHYKIEDRALIRDTASPDWFSTFKRYLGELKCPISPNDRAATVDWLLGLAVQFEYSDNVEKYKNETAEKVLSKRNTAPKVIHNNPLDSLDFSSPDFKVGVNHLAAMLKVTVHPDPVITLKGVSHLIRTRLSNEAIASPGEVIHQGKPYPIFEADLGFDTGDIVMNNAGKVLRLMYIHDLRELQTRINECIVSVQKITANPKTDTRLGKVGRF